MDTNNWMIFMNNCQLLLNMHKRKRRSLTDDVSTVIPANRINQGRIHNTKLPLVSEEEVENDQPSELYSLPRIEISEYPPVYTPPSPLHADKHSHYTERRAYIECLPYPESQHQPADGGETDQAPGAPCESETGVYHTVENPPAGVTSLSSHEAEVRRARSVSETISSMYGITSDYTNPSYQPDIEESEAVSVKLSLPAEEHDSYISDDVISGCEKESSALLVDTGMQTSGDWEHLLQSLNNNTLVNNTLNQQLCSSLTNRNRKQTTAAWSTDELEDEEEYELEQMPLLSVWRYSDACSTTEAGGCTNSAYNSSTLSSLKTSDITITSTDDCIRVELIDAEDGTEDTGMSPQTDTDNEDLIVDFSNYAAATAVSEVVRKPDVDKQITADRWQRIRYMQLEQQGRVLRYHRPETRTAPNIKDVAFAQGRQPLNIINYYFKTKILCLGTEGCIAIGLTDKSYPSFEMPGWRSTSIAYHADDGKLYTGGNKSTLLFGPTLEQGDEIGMGILFSQDWITTEHHKLCTYNNISTKQTTSIIQAYSSTQKTTLQLNKPDHHRLSEMKIFVTLNGTLLGLYCTEMRTRDLYPTIGLLSEGSAVLVDLYPLLTDY